MRCVPGLADIEPDLFGAVSVLRPDPGFASMPPSSAREAAPRDCQYLPRLGARDNPELNVNYRPATDAAGKPFGARFPENNGEDFHVRFLVATHGATIASKMREWVSQCRMWGVASTLNDNGVDGWMIAESADKLNKYQAGDVGGQWPYVTHTAAKMLSNGVIVQAFYRTNDPSAKSREEVLREMLSAAGRPTPSLPQPLAEWSPSQISSLLPALATSVSIDASASRPGERWSLCPEGDHGPTPLYDTEAVWRGPPPTTEDQASNLLFPTVSIDRARPGSDYLTELRREIAICTAHLADKAESCTYGDSRQSLDSDSTLVEGVDTLRITHQWNRVEKVQGYDRCVAGVEALRVTQVRGLIAIARTYAVSAKGPLGNPRLPLSSLDELVAQTVRAIKAA